MIRYFCKSLKPSVQAKMEQRGWELNSFKKLVQKAVDVEAKADFGPAPIFAIPISIASRVATPLILLLPKFHPKVIKWRIPKSRNWRNPRNQKHLLLSVPRTLRPPRRLGKRRRTIAATDAGTEHQRMAGHRKGTPQPPGSTTPPPLRVEIHEGTRTEAAYKS